MDILFRCLIGGVIISLFAILGDIVKPKAWAEQRRRLRHWRWQRFG